MITVKPVQKGHSQKDQKLVFKTNYCLMQGKSIADCSLEHSAILSTFIKLPFAIKICVLSIFEWPLKTGFTVVSFSCLNFSSADGGAYLLINRISSFHLSINNFLL